MFEFHFILCSPARAANIGVAARSIKALGIDKIHFCAVDRTLLQSDEVRAASYQSYDMIENAGCYDSLGDALTSIHPDFVIACTARHRQQNVDYLSSVHLHEFLANNWQPGARFAVIFGPEATGLSNQDLSFADLLCTIDQDAPGFSLNLATAVSIIAYELSQSKRVQTKNRRTQSAKLAPGEWKHFHARISAALQNPDWDMDERLKTKILSRLSHMTAYDVRLMQAALAKLAP